MDATMDGTPLLKMTNISKSFGEVHALTEISLNAVQGEVHAIVGENGAGKSTLMKIIAGALHPDSGMIEFAGRSVVFREPRDAFRAGIATVYQEPSFFNDLSVVENIYLGEESKTRSGALNWEDMTRGAVEALERGINVGEFAFYVSQENRLARTFDAEEELTTVLIGPPVLGDISEIDHAGGLAMPMT